MSLRKSIPPGHSEQVLLRWSDAANSRSHAEFVHVIQAHLTEAVIRCNLKVRGNTPVYLVGKHYTVNGIVRSCRKAGSSYIVRIAIDENLKLRDGSEADPGVFVVEDFLTEEQEAKILKDFERDTPRKAISPSEPL
jgi:hypothetical protein